MPVFEKTNVDLQRNFVRGAARLVICDLSTPFLTRLSDVIYMTAASNTNEVQTITIAGTPTGGTFTLSFKGYTTQPIPFNATGAVVDAALEAIGSIGTNGVAVTGGPGPGTPYVVTFTNQLAAQAMPSITSTSSLTGGTTPTITTVRTTPGIGQYDAKPGYSDLGATKGGITVNRNNAEETFDVDQIQADIMSVPTGWDMNVSSQMAQNDIDMVQYLWEGGNITLDATTGERTLTLGTPTSYRQKRLVVLFQRQSLDGGVTAGLIRAYGFRITQRSPQESSHTFNKTGEQVSTAFTWRALPDASRPEPNERFGAIIDQA